MNSNSDQFCLWLDGVLDAIGNEVPTKDQMKLIRLRLDDAISSAKTPPIAYRLGDGIQYDPTEPGVVITR